MVQDCFMLTRFVWPQLGEKTRSQAFKGGVGEATGLDGFPWVCLEEPPTTTEALFTFMAVVLRTVPLQPWRCGVSSTDWISGHNKVADSYKLAILLVTFLEWWKRDNFKGVVGNVQKGSKGCAVENEDETKFNDKFNFPFPSSWMAPEYHPPKLNSSPLNGGKPEDDRSGFLVGFGNFSGKTRC